MKPHNGTVGWIAALLVFAGVVAGCGDGDGDGDEPASVGDASAAAPADSTTAPGEFVGVLWEATGFLDGASIDAPSEPGTIQFMPNGFVAGSDGCDGFGHVEAEGRSLLSDGLLYELEGNEITFSGGPVSTLIGCADTRYQDRIQHVLSGTVTYAIEADTLTLSSSNDSSGVVFTVRPG